jgi:hypothetical protein
MGRTGGLLLGALFLVLVAAGALVWTGALDMKRQSAEPTGAGPALGPPSAPVSPESELVRMMNEAAAGGGFTATFSEQDAHLWKIAAGHQLERFSLDSPNSAVARLSSSTPISTPTVRWEDLGLSVALPLEFSNQHQGSQVEIGIVARSPAQNGSDALNIVFATQQTGNTGWNAIPLTAQFQLHTVRWRVPPAEGGYHARPIVVVHADASGSGRAIELLGVYVKRAR